jgi:hypothetical protein
MTSYSMAVQRLALRRLIRLATRLREARWRMIAASARRAPFTSSAGRNTCATSSNCDNGSASRKRAATDSASHA